MWSHISTLQYAFMAWCLLSTGTTMPLHPDGTQQRSRPAVQKRNQKKVHPRVIDSPRLPVTLEGRPSWLLGRCSRQFRKGVHVRT
jgi:hypothetical protein